MNHEEQAQRVEAEVKHYGRTRGAEDWVIRWGVIGAHNALQAGLSGFTAYEQGRHRIDDALEVLPCGSQPLTNGRRMLQQIAGTRALSVTTTGMGVRGSVYCYSDDARYTVRIEPESPSNVVPLRPIDSAEGC